MLVSLTLQNWRSIRFSQQFDMTASRERVEKQSLTSLPPMYGTKKILPLAAIYGPNASGKTNLVDALSFIRFLVVEGIQVDRPIPIEPYRLGESDEDSPFLFDLEMLIDNRIYRYGATISTNEILEEHLYVERTRSEEILYTRHKEGWVFGKGYDDQRIRFVAEGTRTNQLFLHNSVSQNVNSFRPMYDWFSKTLIPVGLEAQYGAYYSMLLRDDFREFIGEKLRKYDTGATGLKLKEIPKESIHIPSSLLTEIVDSTVKSEGRYSQLRVNTGDGPEIYIIDAHNQEPTFQKVLLIHNDASGHDVEFELSQESTGTQRLLELLPMFFDLASIGHETGRVYVVDELDRSFHTELTDDLVRTFIDCCSSETRNQLIFTTHDLLLMEDFRLRKDEQWVFENTGRNGTTFTCVGRHKDVRTDTSILNAYRNGVFGGYPSFKG